MGGYGHMMDSYSGYGHMNGYGGLGGFGLESFGGLIVLAVVVVAVIFHINYLQNTNRPSVAAANTSTGNNNAINILNEKFARGEITEDEYKHKKGEILRN